MVQQTDCRKCKGTELAGYSRRINYSLFLQSLYICKCHSTCKCHVFGISGSGHSRRSTTYAGGIDLGILWKPVCIHDPLQQRPCTSSVWFGLCKPKQMVEPELHTGNILYSSLAWNRTYMVQYYRCILIT